MADKTDYIELVPAGKAASESLPKATHTGTVDIAGIGISCAVLEDGTRVLTQGGFLNALGRSGNPKSSEDDGEVFKTPVFLSASNLQPFVTQELSRSSRPIIFRHPDNNLAAYGYRAELLPEVCEVYLKARDVKALHRMQEGIADRCYILMRGLARLGIVALVDEATGFQYSRARNALEQLLEQWILQGYEKWLKVFPDEYYAEIYRLRGWPYDDVIPRNRPGVVGKITNDVIYSRLAPFVLDALKEVTPRNQEGKPKRKFHQHLTPEHGRTKLKEHLDSVVSLMRISSNWNQFIRFLDKAKPVQNGMMQILHPEDPPADTESTISRDDFEAALKKVVSRPLES